MNENYFDRCWTALLTRLSASIEGFTCLLGRFLFPLAIFLNFAGALALAQPADPAVPVSCVMPPLGSLNIGYSLTHEKVNFSAENVCHDKRDGGASIDGASNIVKHYDNPDLRKRVQMQLAAMAADGAKVVRTIFWFRHAEDERMANLPADPLGLMVAENGKVAQKAIDNLLNFVGDAQAAGYVRFFVVVGAQGAPSPKCRTGSEWGACFDERLLEKTWSVIDEVVGALHTSAFQKLEVIVDLSPENCAPSPSRMPVYRNMRTYTRYIITRYRDKYRDNKFVASCGTGGVDLVASELSSQEDLFRKLGVRPAAIDVHIYEIDPDIIRHILLTADEAANRLGVPLDILETYYDHPNIFRVISELRSAYHLSKLQDLLIWPRRTTSSCQINVQAPYDMRALDTNLGRRNGDELQVCQRGEFGTLKAQ